MERIKKGRLNRVAEPHVRSAPPKSWLGGHHRDSLAGREEQPTIAIVTATSLQCVGGLSAYARLLASGLRNASFSGAFVTWGAGCSDVSKVSVEPLPWPTNRICFSHWNRLWQPLFTRMGSRPSLHNALEGMVGVVLSGAKMRNAVGHAGVIHFIGTGWDFTGFAFYRAARAIGATFTLLPAIHPNSWGDDCIDIRLYQKADTVFCLSDYEKHHLAARGVPEEKLVRCGLPPMCRSDGDRQGFRAKHNIRLQPTVLFLGRRDNGKGYPALLAAWKAVLKEIPEAVLLLAGPGGDEYLNLRNELPAYSIRDLGIPDEREKADALAACDVFCLPSANESFGIVYVEAWFYGKPVICGTAPASRELIKCDATGLWSDGTAESIAEQVTTLLVQPELRARMGEAGTAVTTN